MKQRFEPWLPVVVSLYERIVLRSMSYIGNVAATGIQALDMQLMTKRVRPEWFYRYLLEPTKYRPGTRMPNIFPEGQSVYKQIYEGNAEHQIAALWMYLSQGNDAALPDGLQRDQIVLEPTIAPSSIAISWMDCLLGVLRSGTLVA